MNENEPNRNDQENIIYPPRNVENGYKSDIEMEQNIDALNEEQQSQNLQGNEEMGETDLADTVSPSINQF